MSAPVFRVTSVAEIEARLHAERSGRPFVILRDHQGRQRLVGLPREGEPVVIGRRVDGGLQIDWDSDVSRVHAVLESVAQSWTVVDNGLSRNGTFVNGARVHGRRRLRDGDVIRCGSVDIAFCDPRAGAGDETSRAPERRPELQISPAQHRVLVALCRPLRDEPYAVPATNREIANELSLSVDAVKTHLRHLAELLGVDELPQNKKRAQLAWQALKSGAVTAHDLSAGGSA